VTKAEKAASLKAEERVPESIEAVRRAAEAAERKAAEDARVEAALEQAADAEARAEEAEARAKLLQDEAEQRKEQEGIVRFDVETKDGLTEEVTYSFDDEIGRGAFGVVFEGTMGDRQVAVKVISEIGALDEGARSKLQKETKKEARKMMHFRDASLTMNVMGLLGSLTDSPKQLVLVMELMTGGSLREVLNKGQQSDAGSGPDFCITDSMRRSWGLQVCNGMAFLHSNGIIHRDLKSMNILCNCALTQLKIGDFGLATTDTNNADLVTSMTMTKGSQANNGIVGTPQWIAPEVLAGDCWTMKGDIFSLGIVLFEIFTGAMPWHGMNQYAMNMKIAKGENALEHYYGTHPPLPIIQDTVIRACLVADPEKRPPEVEIMAVIGSTAGASAVNVGGKNLSYQRVLDLVESFQTRIAEPPAGAAEDIQEQDVVAFLMKTGIFKTHADAEKVAEVMENEGCELEDLLNSEEISDEDLATYIPKSIKRNKFIKYRAGGSMSLSAGGSMSTEADSTTIIPLPPRSIPNEAVFEAAFQDDVKFYKKEKTMEIAAGKIAELVIAAVQAYTGNIGGLASAFVGSIGAMTANFGYCAVDEKDRKAHVIFDPETDYFLLCTLEKISKKRKGKIPLFKCSQTELTITMFFVKIKAGNDVAREKLQQMANDKTDQLYGGLRELVVF